MYTLGINAAFHDSSACIVKDGELLAEKMTTYLGFLHSTDEYKVMARELLCAVDRGLFILAPLFIFSSTSIKRCRTYCGS